MEETTPGELFEEFKTVTKAQWLTEVEKDLKGAAYGEKMLWDTGEGFMLDPYFVEEDMQAFAEIRAFENSLPGGVPGATGPRAWHNLQAVKVHPGEAASKRALLALKNGADGLLFDLSGIAAEPDRHFFSQLMDGVLAQYCPVSFLLGQQPPADFTAAYLDYLSGTGTPLAEVSGGLFAQTGPSEMAAAAKAAERLPRFRAFTCGPGPSSPGPSSRGPITAKIAAALQLFGRLAKAFPAKKDLEKACAAFEICYPLSPAYFPEMAGLRALRFLLGKMAAATGLAVPVQDWQILALTQPLPAAADSPHQNMLANTTQALAAILGGCNSLAVLPHDYQAQNGPHPMGERVARNVSLILREESFLDKNPDPVAGSYYVTVLTAKLAEQAWERFRLLPQD